MGYFNYIKHTRSKSARIVYGNQEQEARIRKNYPEYKVVIDTKSAIWNEIAEYHLDLFAQYQRYHPENRRMYVYHLGMYAMAKCIRDIDPDPGISNPILQRVHLLQFGSNRPELFYWYNSVVNYPKSIKGLHNHYSGGLHSVKEIIKQLGMNENVYLADRDVEQLTDRLIDGYIRILSDILTPTHFGTNTLDVVPSGERLGDIFDRYISTSSGTAG